MRDESARSAASRRVLTVAIGCLVVGWVYWGPVGGYLADQHYQEHFVYLWLFLAVALSRTLRGPFRLRIGFAAPRDKIALSGALLSGALLWCSAVAGSTTGQRLSLVVLLTSLAVAAVPRWSLRRCVAHGLLLTLCFGVPYSLYFPLTSQLQWGIASLVAMPARLGLASYEVIGQVVVFPHYRLTITADCSGIGQLLTFSGIAALGMLSGVCRTRRALLVMVAAVALAWLSNVARVALFVGLVGVGFTAAIDDPALHAALGFVLFLPFVVTLVWLILRTHTPLPTEPVRDAAPGRHHLAWLCLPVVVAHLAVGDGAPALPMPAYFSQLSAPPGHHVGERAPSEAVDRIAYDTPWLVNARFVSAEGRSFDLLHYVTASRTHLCVHKVANCLQDPDSAIHYLSPVEVGGRQWWRLAVDAGAESSHVYFAFEAAGARRDDSWATSWEVFAERLRGGDGIVRFWRVVLPQPRDR